jgi:hypothetical protein
MSLLVIDTEKLTKHQDEVLAQTLDYYKIKTDVMKEGKKEKGA